MLLSTIRPAVCIFRRIHYIGFSYIPSTRPFRQSLLSTRRIHQSSARRGEHSPRVSRIQDPSESVSLDSILKNIQANDISETGEVAGSRKIVRPNEAAAESVKKRFTPKRYHSYETKKEQLKPLNDTTIRKQQFILSNPNYKANWRQAALHLRGESAVNGIINTRLDRLETLLPDDPIFRKAGLDETGVKQRFEIYKTNIISKLDTPAHERPKLLQRLHDAYKENDLRGLDLEIKYSFFGYIFATRFTETEIRNQRNLADLRYPGEWFSRARASQREVHLHVGPTNSGKTYHALKRLEEAEGIGVYAGPLRLLAHEVYMRLNANGKLCHLVTGEERRVVTTDPVKMKDTKIACTVEMVPLHKKMKVAVIDEIQMIGSEERGWAWTQAFLGLSADEVHLCGEERAVTIVRELTAAIGDKLVIHKYERLSPLKMMSHSLQGNLRNLRKGDCIVAFSVMVIHGLRQLIEKTLKKKVAVIYGSLPPETRAQQAKLFNDPNNDYDFLIASDAVGMGLNLSIRRMIFHSSTKTINGKREIMAVADVKQIAGRAGRYSTAEEDIQKVDTADSNVETDLLTDSSILGSRRKQPGLVTAIHDDDYSVIKKAFRSEPKPITSAGIFPPEEVLESFAKYFRPGTPFSYVLVRLHELSQVHPSYHLCNLRSQVGIADSIEPVEGLSIQDRIIFCSAPFEARKEGEPELARAFAHYVAHNEAISISDMEILDLELLDQPVDPNRQSLRRLEHLHKGVIAYLWLSYRFAGVFVTRALAFHVKTLVEEKIGNTLASMSIDLTKLEKAREVALKKLLNRTESSLPEDKLAQRTSESLAAFEGQEWSESAIFEPSESQDNENEEESHLQQAQNSTPNLSVNKIAEDQSTTRVIDLEQRTGSYRELEPGANFSS